MVHIDPHRLIQSAAARLAKDPAEDQRGLSDPFESLPKIRGVDDQAAEAIRKVFCEQFTTVWYEPWEQLTKDSKAIWLKMAHAAQDVIGL